MTGKQLFFAPKYSRLKSTGKASHHLPYSPVRSCMEMKLWKKAQAYIEKNLDEKISVEHLSSKFAVGRRNFDRRFIKATGNTPVEYSQRVKIESAKKAFENTRKTVSEVMYEVGYSDLKAFREVFRKITGMSPLDYRAKYNKEAVIN